MIEPTAVRTRLWQTVIFIIPLRGENYYKTYTFVVWILLSDRFLIQTARRARQTDRPYPVTLRRSIEKIIRARIYTIRNVPGMISCCKTVVQPSSKLRFLLPETSVAWVPSQSGWLIANFRIIVGPTTENIAVPLVVLTGKSRLSRPANAVSITQDQANSPVSDCTS